MAEQELWFHHLGVSVADLGASIAWWQDMLGFELLRRYAIESIPAEVAVLGNGALHVELLSVAGATPADPARRVPDEDLRTLGNKHVAFCVGDVRGFIATIGARGADIVWLREFSDGRAASFVRDNEGNLIEFVQWPKVASPRAAIA